MRKLLVRYCGWGENWPLGRLADDARLLLFEYSEEALRARLELSPIRMPLRAQAYGDFPAYLSRLPGFIADSLPDGWGLMLMDRYVRRKGREPAMLSPLDRLALVGSRGLGALTYEPAEDLELTNADVTLLEIAQEVDEVLTGSGGEVLEQLLVLGGSPHGARPKVLVGYDQARGTISTRSDAQHVPYLIKFPAHDEHKEVCAIELTYCLTARACGLEVPDVCYFDLGPKHAAFGTARFDIEAGMRVPMHTLAGVLHADFNIPSLDYTSLLRAARVMTTDEREVVKAFDRAVFNVLFNNRDDHSKNFGFRLGKDRRWRLAPAYDLTCCVGPGGEHQLAVCGEARRITRQHLIELAKQGGVKRSHADASIERILDKIDLFERTLREQPIRSASVQSIVRAIRANAAALRAGKG
jgi:serine/threonine-protein kinase HipA